MISVIMPVYNVASTIERAMNSVLAQSYSEIELIIVDDGSTDSTGYIIDQYALQYPKKILVFHKENQGVTTARLEGVKKASGEWIGFIDGDDEIEPDMYELLLNNAEKYQADISHSGYQMMFADGRINYFHNTGCLVQQDKVKGLQDLLDGSLVEPGLWNKLYSKKLFYNLINFDIIDTKIRINEDLLMNYILFSEADNSVFVDVCKYHYIVRDTSATRVELNENRIYDPIRVKQKIVDMDIAGMKDAACRAYIGTCISVYNTLIMNTKKKFSEDEKRVYALIKDHKTWIRLMGKKQQMAANLILYFPVLYRVIYHFYARYLFKNLYE